jgi:hypothetical protein
MACMGLLLWLVAENVSPGADVFSNITGDMKGPLAGTLNLQWMSMPVDNQHDIVLQQQHPITTGDVMAVGSRYRRIAPHPQLAR